LGVTSESNRNSRLQGPWGEFATRKPGWAVAAWSLHPIQSRDAVTVRNEEKSMNLQSKRLEGAAEEFGGKLKNAVGKLTGNKEMQVTGKAHELKGKVKQKAAKAAKRAKDSVEKVMNGAARATTRWR
jgi:uncharacterized protein YjbJ (UPF0337 family)